MAFAGSLVGSEFGPPVGGFAPGSGGVLTAGVDGVVVGALCANAAAVQSCRASPPAQIEWCHTVRCIDVLASIVVT
jgi:hypothetical protein